ncbi:MULTISPECIES: nucleotidyl transferase AbiEii/AbiGii toxin family protein [unclassified Microbacterium]|uniref:nucleotidyl transferase AbiEii/AbiGii toxin family protein n=1 Tax=unclassified Microbacterium TaxID=2609290 RepID=UPI0025D90DB2|nr:MULTISPECIES: nucleotidyl transferase AbiEii/AbiGii toxin family protein [unclassified Microbacterium]
MSDILDTKRLNAQLAGRIKAVARKRGVAAILVRKQYVFTLFLSRMFGTEERPPWVLLGGNALLIRAGGGRFTEDIDLARESPWGDLDGVRKELQALADQNPERDPFRFEIYAIDAHSEADPFGYGTKTAKARVRATLDGVVFDTFTIDITSRRHLDGPVDDIPLAPIIDHETLNDLPAVPTTPAENHLADKVCAMYEPHGEDKNPSTRYRDLADIVRLIAVADIDAERLHRVLVREKQRRKIDLPEAMVSPGDIWSDQFPRAARDFAEYPSDLYSLEASLNTAGTCLNPILAGEVTSGIWRASDATWTPSPA